MPDDLVQPEYEKRRSRPLRWVLLSVALCVGVGSAVFYVVRQRVWTDDRTIRVRSAEAELREVLWTKPQPLPGSFNSPDQDYEPSVSPDGNELFFVRGKPGHNADIYVSRRERGRWLEPLSLKEINTDSDDLGPRLTADGRFLLFYSDRPGGQGGYDVWAARRNDDGSWNEPFNLGPSVNGEFNEYSPAPTPDGKRLYFASNRKASGAEQREAWRATIRQSAIGDYDLYVAERDGEAQQEGGAPAAPTTVPTTSPTTAPSEDDGPAGALPSPAPPDARLNFRPATEVPGVNTAYHEGASCVSTAGDFLYFASNRPGGFGKFDLYRCRLRDDGPVGKPENLGPQVNTADNEADPQLAAGGFHLYFSSDRAHADARGGYDLFSAESREVYVLPQPTRLPHFGWSAWILLGGLLLLWPLLRLVRGTDEYHLNLLQKCLLVSVLIHVLLTIALSLFVVSRQIVEFVRTGGGGDMEIGVVAGPGTGGGGVDIGEGVRRQLSDTPVEMPEPAAVGQAQVASAEVVNSSPASIDVDLPTSSRVPADVMTVPAPAAPRVSPQPAAARVAVAAPDAAAALEPQVQFGPAVRVSAPEAEVRPGAEATAVDRAAAAPTLSAEPRQVALGVQASDARGESLARPPQLVRPNMLSVVSSAGGRVGGGKAGGVGPAGFDPAASAGALAGVAPSVGGPTVAAQRVAAASPGEPGGGAAAPVGVVRQPTQAAAGGGGSGAGGPVAVQTPVPAASPGVSGGGGPGAGGGTAVAAPLRPGITPGTGGGTAGAVAPKVEVANFSPGAPAGPAGGGAGGGKSVSAPAPTLAASDQPVAATRAGSPGSGALSAAAGGSPQSVGTDAAPVGAGAVTRSGVVASAPTTRPVVPGNAVASAGRPAGARAGDLVTPIQPAVAAGSRSGPVARAGAPKGGDVPTSAEEPTLASARVAGPAPSNAPAAVAGPSVSSTLPAAKPSALGSALGAPGDVRPRSGAVVPVPLNLEVAIAGPTVAAPEPLAQRAPEARKPLLEKMGGSKQSEDAVAKALGYLSRQQEPDGRWTYVQGDGQRRRRGRTPHDTALTGLATLCFLAADHTPAKAGPYRQVVSSAIDFLISNQRPDGDLRGPMAGGGADAGNLYDQGIATLALAEAGLMTGDKRIVDAALKGARFIVESQDEESGGWRYTPGEFGDTSVFGWQVMALHSAQQLGFEIPQRTRDGATRYVRLASQGRSRTLAGYQPGHGATTAMTAELLFARILLGERITDEGEAEACRFLSRQSLSDFYGTYYASLSLMQLQNEAWKHWNERMRDTLVRTQRRGGDDDGCWSGNIQWADRGGRIYSTALGCLTLEVYYRYLPMRDNATASPPAPPENRPAE